MIPLPESIQTQLPVLSVVVPLLSAPLCLLLGRRAWVLAFLSALVSFGVAVNILDRVMAEGMISYALGGWVAPWGIEYRLDYANAFVLLIVTGMAAVTLPWSVKSVAQEIPAGKIGQFYTLLMLCFAGLSGITVTGDAFNVFVFLEISSLSTYVLISMGQDRRALTASFQYLIMGTIGGTFFLIGVGLLR